MIYKAIHEARLLLLTTYLAGGQIFAIGDDSVHWTVRKIIGHAIALAKHPNDAISDHYGYNCHRQVDSADETRICPMSSH